MKLSLILPAYSYGPPMDRTISSCAPICDETIIISTCLFPQDLEMFHAVADKVVELPWNYVFNHGFGEMHNQATQFAKNDWLILLGVGETMAQQYGSIEDALGRGPLNHIFRCDHHNDINTWGRIWHRNVGISWGGIIHEELSGGGHGGVIFRMADTHKEPRESAFEQEALRFIKTCSYNHLYHLLLHNPALLGATNAGWLGFVNGARESIEAFCEAHRAMIDACVDGDKERFLGLVRSAVKPADGVKYEPVGVQATGVETISSL